MILSPLLLLVAAIVLGPLTLILFAAAWFMFFFVLPVYAFILSVFVGPLGAVAAFISVLHLSRKVTVLLLTMIFFPRLQGVMFDTVLSKEGMYEVVFAYNLRRQHSEINTNIPWLLVNRVIPFFIQEAALFVLHFIPILGPLISIAIRAPTLAFNLHQRYYKLANWKHEQTSASYWKFTLEYFQFGVVASVLELIPGLTFLFMFTNAVGMALWTVDNRKLLNDIAISTHVPESPMEEINIDFAEEFQAELPAAAVKKREYLKAPLNNMKARIWSSGRNFPAERT